MNNLYLNPLILPFTCVDKTIFKKHNYFSIETSNNNCFFSQKIVKNCLPLLLLEQQQQQRSDQIASHKDFKNEQLKQFWKGSFNIVQNYYNLNSFRPNKKTYFLPNFKTKTGVYGIKQTFFITINLKNKFVTLEQNSLKNSSVTTC